MSSRPLTSSWGESRKGPAVNFLEIAIWFAIAAFLVIRVAMLAAFILLPVIIVRMIHRHSTA